MNSRTTVKLMTIKEVAQTKILSEYSLRVLAKQNKIPLIRVNKKVFINYDALVQQLSNIKADEEGKTNENDKKC